MSTTNALGGLRHVIGQLTRARLMRHKTIPLGALEAELRAIERDVETLVEAAKRGHAFARRARDDAQHGRFVGQFVVNVHWHV